MALLLYALLLSPLKDDLAWLLWVAREWLHGRALYSDLVEVNPPLIVWLSALPVLLGEWSGYAPKTFSILLTTNAALLSAWVSANFLRGLAPSLTRRAPVFAVISCVFLLYPGVDFGQREHLLAMAMIPYLCLLAREIDRRPDAPLWQGVAVGLIAGIGCALKPQYLLTIAVMELLVLWRRGFRIRVAPVAATVSAGLYGLAVLRFYPEYLHEAVPLAVALYGATDTSFQVLLQDSWRLLLGLAALLLATFLTHRDMRGQTILATLLLFALTATAVMFWDGKNWFYHRMPANFAMILAMALWLSMLPGFAARSLLGAAGRPLLRRPMIRRLALPCCLVVLTLGIIGQAATARLQQRVALAMAPQMSTEVRLEGLIRREKVRTYVAFSEWIGLGFPVVNNTGVTWASRFDSMWALHGELWRTRQDGRPPRAWPIGLWVAQDFIRGCPDMVVVDRRESINYIAVLTQQDPAFAAAWLHYRLIAAFDGLQVFRRIDSGCGATVQTGLPLIRHMEPPSGSW